MMYENGPVSQVEKLYRLLMSRQYPEPFCREVCRYMNTDYTAGRMLGYLYHYSADLRMEEIADEVITILSDRERFIQKAATEQANASYNAFLNRDRDEEE